jgi:hypothetical protein
MAERLPMFLPQVGEVWYNKPENPIFVEEKANG